MEKTSRIYHPARTREIVERYGFNLKKSLGQNFLIDGNILAKIVEAAELGPGIPVLEVGPGIGSLTEAMLLTGSSVTSIEIDRRLCPILEEAFGGDAAFTLVSGDACDEEVFECAAQNGPAERFVSNLPYVVTTPVLERLFRTAAPIERAVIMVQSEVARRMTAKPGSREYSALSVFVSAFSKATTLFDVRPGSFFPNPGVVSSVVLLTDFSVPEDADAFMRTVHDAFSLRRKTLKNTLSHAWGIEKSEADALLRSAGIDPARRAETLDMRAFCSLHQVKQDYVHHQKGENE